MDTTPKYFVCKHCGNVIEKLHDAGVAVVCCGEAMAELTANTTDAAQEKHVPAFQKNGDTIEVQIGSVPHPMLEEHHIAWIWLQTKLGGQRKQLQAGDEPKASFVVAPGDEAVAIFEWCNIHGLWKVDL